MGKIFAPIFFKYPPNYFCGVEPVLEAYACGEYE